MIKTTVKPRCSGKTKSIITRMKPELNLFCIVPNKTIKMHCYPKTLHNRILCANSDNLLYEIDEIVHEYHAPRFVFDEGFMLPPDELAKLYYHLGQMNINLEVIGSIISPDSKQYNTTGIDYAEEKDYTVKQIIINVNQSEDIDKLARSIEDTLKKNKLIGF